MSLRSTRIHASSHVLTWGVGALIVGSVLAAGLVCAMLHYTAVAQAAARGLAASGVFVRQTLQAFEAADLVLHATSNLMLSQDGSLPVPSARTHELLKRQIVGLAWIGHITAYDAAGRGVYDSRSYPEPPDSMLGEQAFSAHRDNPVRAREIDGPFRDPLNGEPRVVISRALLDRDGTFQGVVAVSVDSAHLLRLFRTADLGEGSVVALIRQNGPMIARNPPMPIGGTAVDRVHAEPWSTLRALGADHRYRRTSAVDGMVRYVGYREVPGTGLYVATGIPIAEVFEGWWRDVQGIAIAIVFVDCGILLLFHLTRRHAREREGNVAALRWRDRAMAAAQCGLVITDPRQDDNPIVYVNATFERLTGYGAGEMLGRNGRFLASGEINAAARTRLRQAIDRREALTIELQNRHKDGSYYWNELHISPVFDEVGELVNFLGIQTDISDRKAVEQELRQARLTAEGGEARFRDFAASASDWFWEQDADLRFTFVSERFEIVTGFPTSTILGCRRGENATFPFDSLEHDRHLDDLHVHRPFRDVEYAIVDAWGKRRQVSVSGMPIFADDGAFLGYRGIATDITTKVAAEEHARALEIRLQQSIDSMSEGLALYGPDERLILCNDRYRKVFSASAVVIKPGSRYEDIIRWGAQRGQYADIGGDVDAWVAERMAAFRNPVRPVEQHLSNDRWVRCTDYRTADGGTICLRSDVTDLKQAEQMARRSEARLRGIIDASPDAILVIDTGARIVQASQLTQTMFGYAAEELTGLPIEQLMSGQLWRHLTAPPDRHGGAGANPTGQDVTARRQDGSEFPVEVSLNAYVAPEGHMIVAVVRDVTLRRQADKAMLQARKMEALGTLAGGIAHDLNNTLVPIMGLAMLTAMNLPEGSEERQNLDDVVHATDRAKLLVEQILAFSRRETDDVSRIDLRHTVQDGLRLLRSGVPPRIRLRAELPDQEMPIMGNDGQIHQVVMNLCSNAAQAIGARSGEVIVRLTIVPEDVPGEVTAERYVKLCVEDDGIGMNEATQQRMFDPFFTTKGVGEGTGLGLSTVHGVVQRHHGYIDVESAPGKGARFEIYLPVAA